jgi:bifunctional enzyme CysN/CysC
LNQPIAFDAYARNLATGSMIIIDRLTNNTVGAAMILDRETADRSTAKDAWNVAAKPLLKARQSAISAEARAQRFQQKPATILLTGFTGSGKGTIAYALEERLLAEGRMVSVLHGQNMRLGLSKDLGFSADDRSENLRRSAEVARIMNDAGLIVICAFVAPHAAVRENVRKAIGEDRFLEIHLTAPIEVCRARDERGLYALAESGELRTLSGVSTAYEPPESPDLVLPTHEISVSESVDRIVALLESRGIIAND